MEGILIRDAQEADLKAINDIYNHYVLHSTCTYQTEPSSFEERQKWFGEHAAPYAAIVVVEEGKVIGWGSISKFHPRAAYGKTVENSVYLHPDWQGKGIGKAVMKDLIRRAKEAGFHTIIAIISADQAPSLGLHEKLGFVHAGEIKEAGNKFGRWLDVALLQLML
jgi:phosphinothricin acetyltransferase